MVKRAPGAMHGRAGSVIGVLVALSLAALGGACGVRGSLENPQSAEAKEKAPADSGQGKQEDAAPKPHKGFILDGLIR
jgi:predicted small lipoprotein YifL